MSRVITIVADGYEDSELEVPVAKVRQAGHQVVLAGLEKGATVSGKQGDSSVQIETTTGELYPDDFDALLIPGGYSPDHLRVDEEIVTWVGGFFATGKPVAAICHGPQLLIDAEVLRGKALTSWPSIRRDLINAGAIWEDKPVVEDGNLITSRKPEDLDAFTQALLSRLP